eukprot:9504042-Pyramimonas_sp.AAC.1
MREATAVEQSRAMTELAEEITVTLGRKHMPVSPLRLPLLSSVPKERFKRHYDLVVASYVLGEFLDNRQMVARALDLWFLTRDVL